LLGQFSQFAMHFANDGTYSKKYSPLVSIFGRNGGSGGPKD